MFVSPWPYRLIAALLILGAAVLRVLFLANHCPFDLAPDEAHYWDWSRHLDWSYYSKGPLVAWIIRLSCWLLGEWSTARVGSELLAVRIPAVVLGSLLLVSMYALTVLVWRSDVLALAIVACGLTMPLLAAGSAIMTIDSPYTCLWGWALAAGYQAVFRDSRWAWAVLGMLVGVGILAKYTMVLFVPFLGLFLLATPAYRGLLIRPGFWIMAVVAAGCCLPIVIWNAQHGWITLRHAQGHAGLQSEHIIHWLGPFRYLANQFGILLGFWFVVWVMAMAKHRPGRESRPELLYLWWLSAPMFVFFGLFSLKNGGGEPNWPVTAYLSGLVLAAGWLAEQLRSPVLIWRRWMLAWTVGMSCVGLLLTLALHRMAWIQPVLVRIAGPATPERPMPIRRIDPTVRLRGWRTLARAVDSVRDELRGRGIEAELAGTSWTLPGELGFYCAGHPTVSCLGLVLGERHSQYNLWRPNPIDDPQAYRGRTFIVVGGSETHLRQAFEHVEPARVVTHEELGAPINRWMIVIGHGYRGFSSASTKSPY